MKYMHKYVHKGSDRTTMEVGSPVDEVKQFLDSRYIGPHEAFWRLMGNELYTQVPSVMALDVHLPGKQNLIFNADKGVTEVLQRTENSMTSLLHSWHTSKPMLTILLAQVESLPGILFTWNSQNISLLTLIPKMEATPNQLFHRSLTFF
jgi:hypothetical protein